MNMERGYLLVLLVGSWLASGMLAASDSRTLIEQAGAAYQGNLMLNQAAGDVHQQVNARAIGAGSMPGLNIQQQREGMLLEHLPADIHAGIRGGAFTGGSGVLGINQSAGAANQQINGFRIGIGVRPESLDDSSLAQSVALPPSASSAAESRQGGRQVEIDDQAFTDSRGVVQLNQAAGVGNRMVNHLGIRILE